MPGEEHKLDNVAVNRGALGASPTAQPVAGGPAVKKPKERKAPRLIIGEPHQSPTEVKETVIPLSNVPRPEGQTGAYTYEERKERERNQLERARQR